MQQESSNIWRHIGLPMAWHALGKKAASDAALAELIRKYEKEAASNIAYVLAYRGEVDRAFEWLDRRSSTAIRAYPKWSVAHCSRSPERTF